MNVTGKILIIDDEIDICQQLSGFLNDLGLNTKYCTSSEQGIEAFKQIYLFISYFGYLVK